ncbi:MAG TPA: RNA 3'-terminal phosphate cyclase [Candidatus Nanoarchaeia archaeon]|nr:RNA 3'-terminal phosphate cyclase [Candidatus Nanoarchaeia archaeon]
MIELDGSHLEGGGQIVRTALALSMVTQQAFRVTDIRKGRKDPGLKAQHLAGINALVELSGSRCDGAEIGSPSITFYPKPFMPKRATIDIGTAGSITLVLQSLLVPAILATKGTALEITGGTDVSWSPSIDYLIHVIIPQLQKYAKIDIALLKRGYYPAGGGKVNVTIKPHFDYENKHLAPLLELVQRGRLFGVKGVSHCSSDLASARVSERQANAAQFALKRLGVPIDIQIQSPPSLSTGSGITLWAPHIIEGEVNMTNPVILGSDALGEKGVPAEDVGNSAAKALLEEIDTHACVDKHLADQLIPLLGLFGGRIKTSTITSHTITNIYVTEKFLPRTFLIDEKEKIITVQERGA